MNSIEFLIFFFWFGVAPFLLHEIGHWLALKYYSISYELFFDWKTVHFGFKEIDGSVESLKVGLAGAFPPLLVLAPCILLGDVLLILLGLSTSLLYTLWSCLEVWFNIPKVESV